MDIGNRAAAEETLRELENSMYNVYIIGNADVARYAEELREALKKAE